MYKTKQCHNYNTPQGCSYGNKCNFLHPGDRMQSINKKQLQSQHNIRKQDDIVLPQQQHNIRKQDNIVLYNPNSALKNGTYHHQQQQTQIVKIVEVEEKEISINGINDNIIDSHATFTIVVDTSASMNCNNKIDATINGVNDIYKIMDDNDQLAVVAFDTKVETILGLKEKSRVNFDRLSTSLKIRTALGGGTALYDAILSTIKNTPHDNKYAHWQRDLVIITDGENNASSATIDEVAAKIAKPGIKNFHFILIGVGLDSRTEQLLKTKLCCTSHTEYLPCDNTGTALRDVFTRHVKTGFTRRVQLMKERIIRTKTITIQNSQTIQGYGNGQHMIQHITPDQTLNMMNRFIQQKHTHKRIQ